jgi:hypothetical protein
VWVVYTDGGTGYDVVRMSSSCVSWTRLAEGFYVNLEALLLGRNESNGSTRDRHHREYLGMARPTLRKRQLTKLMFSRCTLNRPMTGSLNISFLPWPRCGLCLASFAQVPYRLYIHATVLRIARQVCRWLLHVFLSPESMRILMRRRVVP